MSDTQIKLSEVLRDIVEYAGPLDDPRIGWIGRNSSHPDKFQCERCKAEHIDCTQIEHNDGCSAAKLLLLMRKLAEMVKGAK